MTPQKLSFIRDLIRILCSLLLPTNTSIGIDNLILMLSDYYSALKKKYLYIYIYSCIYILYIIYIYIRDARYEKFEPIR